jgi:hypothetical protein
MKEGIFKASLTATLLLCLAAGPKLTASALGIFAFEIVLLYAFTVVFS